MRKMLVALIVPIVLSGLLLACSSTPSSGTVQPLQDSLSVTLLTDKEVKDTYGWDIMVDPFLSYEGTLIPQVYDFLVFKISVVNSASSQLELIDASANDEKGKVRASFYDVDRFKNLSMKQVETQESSGSFSQRENKVDWYYIPSGTVTLKPGKHSYVFVLVARHPRPDSLTAHVQLLYNDAAKNFDISIPDASY